MTRRNSYDELLEAFDESIGFLSWRAVSVFYTLAAYRLLPVYEEFQKAEQWGDVAAVRKLIDEVFEHAADGPPVSREQVNEWMERAEEMCIHVDDGGVLAGVAVDISCIVSIAAGYLGDPELTHKPGGVDHCLACFSSAIGSELCGMSSPGSAEAVEFYAVVLEEPRFKAQVEKLERDLWVLRDAGDNLPAVARERRDKALQEQVDGVEYARPLLALEKIWEAERRERLRQLGLLPDGNSS